MVTGIILFFILKMETYKLISETWFVISNLSILYSLNNLLNYLIIPYSKYAKKKYLDKYMTSLSVYFVFIPVLSLILLALNIFLSPHNPYQEKNSAFECGFHSFLGQNRTQFSISFFIFALLFLLFDLEILLVYPYTVSSYTNGIYGLIVMLIFFFILTLGFVFELGKSALKIDSRQMVSFIVKNWKQIFYINSVRK